MNRKGIKSLLEWQWIQISMLLALEGFAFSILSNVEESLHVIIMFCNNTQTLQWWNSGAVVTCCLALREERHKGCCIQVASGFFWPCEAWSLQGVRRFGGFSITANLLGPTSWFNHIDRSQHAESSRVKRCVFLRIAPYLSCSSSKPNWQRKAKRRKSRVNTLSLPAQSGKINLAGYYRISTCVLA